MKQQWMNGIDTDNCRNTSFICVTCIIILVTWFLHICDTDNCRNTSFVCVICIIISVTWFLHICDTDNCRNASFVRVTCIIISVTFISVTWLLHMYDAAMDGGDRHGQLQECLLHMCDMTPSYVWPDSFTCVSRLFAVGWLRPVGSLKL